MSATTIDVQGKFHRGSGPGGGQYTGKTNRAPAGGLEETPTHPLAGSFDTVAEKVKAMQEELAVAVEQLADDENWRAYLDTMSRFHRYSFQNQLLIAVQRPDATRVAGFKTWLRLKKPVRKGEKGIAILAPRLVNATDDNGNRVTDDAGRPVKRVAGFTSATVFDVSQTDGDPLPEAFVDLTEEPPEGYIDDLTAAIEQQGYTVRYLDMLDEGKGYTTVGEGRKIVAVERSLTPGSRATVLAHELGHIMCGHTDPDRHGEYHTGHGGKRGVMEVEAESFAYTLSKINGMRTHQRNASEYVAAWQRHEPDAIRKIGETLSKAVKATMTGSSWRNAADAD
ncbi:ArdC-like ssDNA-binding domain-containing protein [Microbacterium sp.]|uniref:ArdC-like ssDNA-binding domain-containing protein n=1 Tax=Microbacterium sp. TaxID=51671 RepID=UPI003A877716